MAAWLRYGQLLPWLVLAASLAITQQLWNNARHEAARELQAEFDFRVIDVSIRVKQRMEIYEQVLLGAQGLFAASKNVERDEFHAYINSLNLEQNLPGIQGVGFAPLVPAAQKDQHIAAMRMEGYPEYTIKPEGAREAYNPIIYLEPLSGRNLRVLGYDNYFEPVRRATIEQARDTGRATISSKLKLLQENEQHAQAGFLMFLPVYKSGAQHDTLAGRRANTSGWVSAPFRMDDLMAGIFGVHAIDLDIEIYDGEEISDQTLMHDADKVRRDHGKSDSRFQAIKHIKIANHTWTLLISSLPGFEVKLDKFNSQLIATVGIIASLLLALITWLAMRAHNKLKQSERNLKRAQRVVNMGSWQFDLHQNALTWSDETYAIFGLPHGLAVSYELFLNCVHPDDRQLLDDAWQAAVRGAPYDIEHRIVVDGQIKWVRETAEVDFDRAGQPVAAFGTVRDITRRKQTEDGLRLATSVFDGSGESILVTDAEVHILSINQAFTRMSGYTLDEVKGKSPRIFASGQHDAKFYRVMWEAINRDGFWKGEIWDRHKTGRIYPQLMSVSAIKDESGMVTHYISVSADIAERKEAEKNIHTLAYYDRLTDLPNRLLLHDCLRQLIATSHRDQQKFALLFLDLDRFKYVNDSMGHAVGDQLLHTVALRLQECVREGDTVSRIGGDEFIVLLRETDAGGAARVADKILKVLAVPYAVGDLQIATHASIGISIYPDHADDADTLIKYADVAMYRVKGEGRSNFQFFTPEMNFHADKLFSMEKDLRLALERNEFILHYQPQLDLSSGKVCGAEALVRWNHPEKGLISPTEFIPVAEETGQILPLGVWVLRTACAQLAAWRREGMAVFPVSVNLSIRQLRQTDLAQLVAAVLEEAQLQPGDLELELTEGIMLGDTLEAMAFLTRMHEMGVRLSIDDFGTGYSSLSYLKKMPLDRLKIDQSFVRDLETDENDAAIVRSIIGLGHRFKLRVIAEGVETQGQLDFLRVRGCDEIQGFYFSRPLSADEFVKFISSNPTLE